MTMSPLNQVAALTAELKAAREELKEMVGLKRGHAVLIEQYDRARAERDEIREELAELRTKITIGDVGPADLANLLGDFELMRNRLGENHTFCYCRYCHDLRVDLDKIEDLLGRKTVFRFIRDFMPEEWVRLKPFIGRYGQDGEKDLAKSRGGKE